MLSVVRTLIFLFFISLSSLAVFADILPVGSYQNSCSNCTYDAQSQTLNCKCQDGNGFSYPSSVWANGCSDIENKGGTLVCVGQSYSNNAAPALLPSGSYKDSCTDCSYDSSQQTLQCKCGDGNGFDYSSSVWVDNCSDIANDGGQLECR